MLDLYLRELLLMKILKKLMLIKEIIFLIKKIIYMEIIVIDYAMLCFKINLKKTKRIFSSQMYIIQE